MLWACAYVDGQERGLLTSDHIVCSLDDYCRFNEVVNVDVDGSPWVYWDADNFIASSANRMELSNRTMGEIRCWHGAKRAVGSQASS